MLNERKVSQAAAFLLLQADGHKATRMELLKLLYLADRSAIKALGFSISGDNFVSMRQGPILSGTYDLIKRVTPSQPDGWDFFVRNVEPFNVVLTHTVKVEDLDELSQAECDLLGSVWSNFGHMSAEMLSAWTHKNCTEWDSPGDSSSPIELVEIAKAVGLSLDDATALVEGVAARERLNRILLSK